ncbi:hypothetical protein EMIHUDRAFT_106715 [Emiliania huxleyi CCMP1516]|uniref:RAP domain-containing protein n=2 Tax=Emiliania huxleyi TaxID=2903 RepID=A0A0D3I6A5_EMIH1|nr:hypothetical protein EMIHUDRAFT_106715 [Emiliania huxleyi CCMP1516]EOD06790.1 hypothetical protein EMIHUDRAFT_106715 [Emiliania huxleyi CCMP1516]|eukprot:XP_005759219.1 hypothetical protein EMIHUDRAFT_106715 [Emiliania huxleyi CCMP1516]
MQERDAQRLSGLISHDSGWSPDELLRLFAAHSTSINHRHAANLWNKLGKKRVERRHEEQLERLALLAECSRVIEVSLARDPSMWSEEERTQLHQWQLWVSLERGADAQQHLMISESQRKLCRDAMQCTQAIISRFQRSVAAALAAVWGPGFEEEHLEPRTGYSLDLALPSSRVAIEVDGPSHFLLPDGRGERKPNGPTLLKRRLLAAAGWRVISVPFDEWDGLRSASARQAYLERVVLPEIEESEVAAAAGTAAGNQAAKAVEAAAQAAARAEAEAEVEAEAEAEAEAEVEAEAEAEAEAEERRKRKRSVRRRERRRRRPSVVVVEEEEAAPAARGSSLSWTVLVSLLLLPLLAVVAKKQGLGLALGGAGSRAGGPSSRARGNADAGRAASDKSRADAGRAASDKSLPCVQWAEAGECKRNPDYMIVHCAAACRVANRARRAGGPSSRARGDADAGRAASDKSLPCVQWAEAGECKRNPDYMIVHCAAACRAAQ